MMQDNATTSNESTPRPVASLRFILPTIQFAGFNEYLEYVDKRNDELVRAATFLGHEVMCIKADSTSNHMMVDVMFPPLLQAQLKTLGIKIVSVGRELVANVNGNWCPVILETNRRDIDDFIKLFPKANIFQLIGIKRRLKFKVNVTLSILRNNH
jgi:hypothetical protein